MLGGEPPGGGRARARPAGRAAGRGGATQLVYVYVDDVDKHFATAKAAGAGILGEPSDQFYGDRTYGAEDPEGHQWSFAQHVRDVAPEDMHP